MEEVIILTGYSVTNKPLKFIAVTVRNVVCVAKTLKMFNSIYQVLSHLLYLMRISERSIQRRVTLALAHLCSPDDQKTIFIDANGKLYMLILTTFVLIVYFIFCFNILLEICRTINPLRAFGIEQFKSPAR